MTSQGQTLLHPLDPLTPQEISQSSQIIRKNYSNTSWIFNSITLQEPPKALLLETPELGSIPRKSFVILIERETGKVSEAVINLSENKLESCTAVHAGNQPTLTPQDCFEAERITKEDGEVRRRCADLGFWNMDLVVADPWHVAYSSIKYKSQ